MRLTVTRALILITVGMHVAAGIVWWRTDQCGQVSAIPGKCLLWIDRGGIHIVPIPK